MAKILIVEDDKALQEVYADTLGAEAGYEIDTADDGEIALQKMQQGGWDLVLLDIILPKINGLDIMERLKSQPPVQNPNKRVVFLTNLDKSEEIERGLKLANGYLIKSQITPGDLVREVGLYLSSASANPQNSQVPQDPANPQQS
ncbi:MAG: response regulator [Patescibacteria group bacterium]|nr:response regulator [Patescibacteria group bacterium]